MYIKYFGLSQSPFRTAPDPEYFYASGQHLRAVDRVVHAIRERAGLVLVMGEIGQGKTTVCRYIQKRYADEFCIGYLGNPFLSPLEFGEQILLEFGVSEARRSSRDTIRSLTDFLLEQERAGRIPVLFLDEAHLLSPAVLEFLLIITNIQHGGKHLLQMVLAGQNEFQETLRHPRFSSLNQRLGTRIQVAGLTAKDVIAYMSFRLAQAGGEGKALFTRPAMTRIYTVTKGNPRLINQVCERLLERAYEERSQHIRRNDVDRLIKDPIFVPLLFPQEVARIPWGGVLCASIALLVMLGISRSLHKGPDCMIVSGSLIAPASSFVPGGVQGLSSLTGTVEPAVTDNAVDTTPSAASARVSAPRTAGIPEDSDEVQQQLQKILELLEKRQSTRQRPPAVSSRSKVPAEEQRSKDPVPVRPVRKSERGHPFPLRTESAVSDRPILASTVHTTEQRDLTDYVLPAVAGVHVDAIVWDADPEFRLAVVNEQIVREGEIFDVGYRLEKIYHEKIRFSKDGRIYEGRLDPGKGRGRQ